MAWRSASQAGKESQWKEGWRCSIFSDRSSPHHLLLYLLRFLKFLSPRLWLLQSKSSSLLLFNTSCSSGCGLNLGFLPSQLFFAFLSHTSFLFLSNVSPLIKLEKPGKRRLSRKRRQLSLSGWFLLLLFSYFLPLSLILSSFLLFDCLKDSWQCLLKWMGNEWGKISLAFSLILLHLQSHSTSDLLHWKYSFSVPVNLSLPFIFCSFVLIKIIIILIRRFISEILATLWESCFLCRRKIGLLLN